MSINYFVDPIVDSEGGKLAIGGVIGLAVFALICVVLIVVGILVWHRSVYNMSHSVMCLSF